MQFFDIEQTFIIIFIYFLKYLLAIFSDFLIEPHISGMEVVFISKIDDNHYGASHVIRINRHQLYALVIELNFEPLIIGNHCDLIPELWVLCQ